jgi:hypothetical protein
LAANAGGRHDGLVEDEIAAVPKVSELTRTKRMCAPMLFDEIMRGRRVGVQVAKPLLAPQIDAWPLLEGGMNQLAAINPVSRLEIVVDVGATDVLASTRDRLHRFDLGQSFDARDCDALLNAVAPPGIEWHRPHRPHRLYHRKRFFASISTMPT